jgi:hypothetical protein
MVEDSLELWLVIQLEVPSSELSQHTLAHFTPILMDPTMDARLRNWFQSSKFMALRTRL